MKILLQTCWVDGKKNHCTVSTSADGSFIRRVIFLYNTKHVTFDKPQQEEREKQRNWKHPQGRVISFNEVWNHILKYTEVITNLNFVIIQKTLLETRTGKSLQNPDNPTKIILLNLMLM